MGQASAPIRFLHDMNRVYIETYGCQMNVADTELMFGLLDRAGYSATKNPAEADVLLVNTCAVRENAERRVIGRMGELKRHKSPGVVLGLVGCMAQRLGQRLLDLVPQVDLVVGPDSYRALPELIDRASQGGRASAVEFNSWEHYEDIPQQRSDKVKAFVTVQRGCDYRCTFCIVPMTRGRERSRRLCDIIGEVRELAAGGITEVTLLGQTVNSYHDGEHDFADLLRSVGEIAGIRRLRFTSPHPNDFTDRVIEAMADVRSVCEHVHLPVQSGSSRVLRRMGRRYDNKQYVTCVERLRGAMPDLAITTDIIVGFPGETEQDFGETEGLVREVGFDDAYTFKYSERAGTAATRLTGNVSEADKAERIQRIITTVRGIAARKNMSLVGSVQEVLVEGIARRGEVLQTRTRTNKAVLVAGPTDWIGSYRTVRLTGTTGATFTGVQSTVEKELTIVG